MRFRMGIVVGFAAGYYLGAKAGRERYEQLRRFLEDMPVETLVDKTRAAVDLAVERVRADEGGGEIPTPVVPPSPPVPPIPPVTN